MSSLLAHALKQEISLPVARLLVLVRTAPQLFKLAPGRGLKDGLQRLDERFSGSLGQGPRLPTESTSCAISLTVCSARNERFLLLRLTPRCWPP
jgi:hypothetical protein